MNIAYGLTILASVQKELGWNLPFPGEIAAWDFEKNLSSAKLIAYHAESTVLSDVVADQILNIANGGMFACGKFWPVLAKQYGIEYGISEVNELKLRTIQVPLAPPPRGFGPAGKVKIGWSFEEWAKKPEVVTAWKTIKERHGITELKDPFSGQNVKDVFGQLDGELLGGWLWSMSMDKGRKPGRHGFVDTREGIFDAIQEMEDLKMLPPLERTDGGEIKY